MKRKKALEMAKTGWIFVIVVLLCYSTGVSGESGPEQHHYQDAKDSNKPGARLNPIEPRFSQEDGGVHQKKPMRRLLADNETTVAPATAEEKSLSFWEEVEEFYADDNNMAMYCVLPLIVLVYGGCSCIYCIYKCRRYLRRRKHKKLRNEDDSSVTGIMTNDLNQDSADANHNDHQPVKTVSSGNNWQEANNAAFANVAGYNVQRKAPLPWDLPQKQPQPVQREDSYEDNSGSRGSSASALEREREKLEQRIEVQPSPNHADNTAMDHRHSARQQTQAPKPPPPVTKASDFSRFQNSKPVQIVPISQKEYQRHMESNAWDPLHNRPFGSRASGGAPDSAEPRKSGRESSWSIRDEIMAKYDALTSLAMAKKTADVLRVNADSNPNMDSGHHPDTAKRKAGRKSKLIFIAE